MRRGLRAQGVQFGRDDLKRCFVLCGGARIADQCPEQGGNAVHFGTYVIKRGKIGRVFALRGPAFKHLKNPTCPLRQQRALMCVARCDGTGVHIRGQKGADLGVDTVGGARKHQPRVGLDLCDHIGPVPQQLIIAGKAAQGTARSQFGVQHMTQPQQHTVGQRQPVAGVQRCRYFDWVAVDMHIGWRNFFLLEQTIPEGHQHAHARILQNKHARRAVFGGQSLSTGG